MRVFEAKVPFEIILRDGTKRTFPAGRIEDPDADELADPIFRQMAIEVPVHTDKAKPDTSVKDKD